MAEKVAAAVAAAMAEPGENGNQSKHEAKMSSVWIHFHSPVFFSQACKSLPFRGEC
jgi:hypothetical protein